MLRYPVVILSVTRNAGYLSFILSMFFFFNTQLCLHGTRRSRFLVLLWVKKKITKTTQINYYFLALLCVSVCLLHLLQQVWLIFHCSCCYCWVFCVCSSCVNKFSDVHAAYVMIVKGTCDWLTDWLHVIMTMSRVLKAEVLNVDTFKNKLLILINQIAIIYIHLPSPLLVPIGGTNIKNPCFIEHAFNSQTACACSSFFFHWFS